MRHFPIYNPERIARVLDEARAILAPAPVFDLTAKLAKSAEVGAFDLTAWMRPRQTINVVRTTCERLRRPLEVM